MTKSDSTVTDRTQLTPMRRDASGRMGMVELFDGRDRSVPWMTRTLYRLYNVQVQEILGREGISTAHWYYLRILAQGSQLNQLELSKRMGIASTTAVPALDRMEKRGLLKRNRDPDDRRRHCVSLTDDGRRLVNQLLPEIVRMISTSFAGIDREEIETFSKVLHQIEQNLIRMVGEAPAGD